MFLILFYFVLFIFGIPNLLWHYQSTQSARLKRMLDIERLCINCKIFKSVQNKTLCKRPVCCQIETEDYGIIKELRLNIVVSGIFLKPNAIVAGKVFSIQFKKLNIFG